MSSEVLDGLAEHDLDIAFEWVVNNPQRYEQALRDGMEPKFDAHQKSNATTERTQSNCRDTDSANRENGNRTESTETDEDSPFSDDDADPPAYRDPDRLRDAYETHDTFTEMTEALGVDVTPHTVRRYMIKYNIHEPSGTTCSDLINTLLEVDPDSLVLTKGNQNQRQGGRRPPEAD